MKKVDEKVDEENKNCTEEKGEEEETKNRRREETGSKRTKACVY